LRISNSRKAAHKNMFSLFITHPQKKVRRNARALLAAFCVAWVVQAAPALADITNTATADGTYNSVAVISNSSTVSVPVVDPTSSLKVVKTADKTVNVVAGDTVTYTYTVTNDGNVTLHNISLTDVHNASGPAPSPNSETLIDITPLGDSSDVSPADGEWSILAPGDSVVFTATYIVTQSDVDNLQ
jgi:large repetitive protein